MTAPRIGFIGFGEVASIFAEGMRTKTDTVSLYSPSLYKVHLSREEGKEMPWKRVPPEGVRVASFSEVIESSDYVLSTVTTQVAKKVAEEATEILQAGQTFVDLNSTSPSIKVTLSEIIERSGADFVEGAVLGAVGATGLQTRILVAGAKGEETAKTLNQLGMNVTHYAPEVGKASMFKMLRSIFSKGLECLILELLIVGRKAGIKDDLWSDITDFMAKKPFDQIAANWVKTHTTAYERRYYEMLQVVETIREIGMDPVMSDATKAFFERSVTYDLASHLPSSIDAFNAVIEALEDAGKAERAR